RGRTLTNQFRTLSALENSLNILKARVLYHKGQFAAARTTYEEVVKNGEFTIPEKKLKGSPTSSSEAENQPPRIPERVREENRNMILGKLRFAEGYFYAKCQLSRISYQVLGGDSEDGLMDRVKQMEYLDDLVKEIR